MLLWGDPGYMVESVTVPFYLTVLGLFQCLLINWLIDLLKDPCYRRIALRPEVVFASAGCQSGADGAQESDRD